MESLMISNTRSLLHRQHHPPNFNKKDLGRAQGIYISGGCFFFTHSFSLVSMVRKLNNQSLQNQALSVMAAVDSSVLVSSLWEDRPV